MKIQSRIASMLVSSLLAAAMIPMLCFAFSDDSSAGDLIAQSASITAQASSVQSMHRLYNPNSGEHFYTASTNEKNGLVKAGWKYEGEGWKAPSASKTPVYRLYSGTDHHYTTSKNERDGLIKAGWRDEGVGWYSDDAKGVPLYRQFNPNVNPKARRNNSGSHNYTTSKNENDSLVRLGWKAEGVGWYGVNQQNTADQSKRYDPEPYAPKYAYEVYQIKSMDQKMYSDMSWPIYVKTNNPNPNSFTVRNAADLSKIEFYSYETTYHDISSQNSGKSNYLKVPGGYIVTINVPSASSPKISVVELDGSSGSVERNHYNFYDSQGALSEYVPLDDARARAHYAICASATLPIVDYDTAQAKWMDEVIAASNITGNMTPTEKMGAISHYLYTTFEYTATNERITSGYLNLAQMQGPYFVTKRWNSYTSPAVLCQFAEKIGGFEEVHNCYGDYAVGTSQWNNYHHLCRVTYKGQYYYYSACPVSKDVNFEMIDFSNKTWFTKLG